MYSYLAHYSIVKLFCMHTDGGLKLRDDVTVIVRSTDLTLSRSIIYATLNAMTQKLMCCKNIINFYCVIFTNILGMHLPTVEV